MKARARSRRRLIHATLAGLPVRERKEIRRAVRRTLAWWARDMGQHRPRLDAWTYRVLYFGYNRPPQ